MALYNIVKFVWYVLSGLANACFSKIAWITKTPCTNSPVVNEGTTGGNPQPNFVVPGFALKASLYAL